MDSQLEALQETETCGSAEQVRAQRTLVQERSWIKSQPALLSQGRSLLLFDAHNISQRSIESLLEKFGRVLIHAQIEKLPVIAESLRRREADVDERLLLLDGDSSEVLARLAQVEQSRKLPPGWSLEGVSSNVAEEVVRSIQDLQLDSQLTPLPGLFIRGIGIQTHTIVLRNERGELVGSATGQNVAETHSSFDGTFMPLSACLRVEARGCGLSPRLLGAIISYGIRKFSPSRVRDIVEEKELPAINLSKACGLTTHETEGFIFASLPDRASQ